MSVTRELLGKSMLLDQALEEDGYNDASSEYGSELEVDSGIEYIFDDEHGHEAGDDIPYYTDEDIDYYADDEHIDQQQLYNLKITAIDLEHAKSLSAAVTFIPDEGKNFFEANKNNKSKLANKEHREEKIAFLNEYQKKHPNESSPMYTKQRFFKAKEERPSRGNAARGLVTDEMNANPTVDEVRVMRSEIISDRIESHLVARLGVEGYIKFKRR